MADTTQRLPDPPEPGRRIGPYHLVERVGVGGMGEVWLAVQKEPLRREVAIKLIRDGRDTREVLARFEAERQALALMEHPNIARVIDAGDHEGRPYFVMEYVHGVPITEYCDGRKLDIPKRLALFRHVCDAVQHAHHKAIVHRDLKPSNVLVTEVDGRPVPKVIDFGVAKATAQPLTELTFHTQFGQLIGTPLYMSPEQADARLQDVDTRADVYSLGVILYELLTGSLPFEPEELAAAGYDGMIRMLREKTPARPSTRVSTLDEEATERATARGHRPRSLHSDLRGDLDWITMRCLEKDRDRRYATPGDLSRDIERHLRLEPVEAGPPSASYRMGRFVRRHRAGVTVALTLLVAVVAIAAVQTIQGRRIAAERDLARSETRRAEAAHLYTLAANEEIPSRSLAYAIASLELADQEHVRRAALRAMQSGPTYHRFDRHPAGDAAWNPHAVAFSPDGRWMAVGWGRGGHLRLHALDSGESTDLVGHDGTLSEVVFTADSRTLLSAATDGTVRAWGLPDGRPLRRFESGPSRNVQCRLLEDSGTVVVWNHRDGAPLSLYRWDHVSGATDTLAVWAPPSQSHLWGSPDVDAGGRWISLGLGHEVGIVPLDEPRLDRWVAIGSHDAPVVHTAFSRRGDRLVTSDSGDVVRIWDLDPPRAQLLRTAKVPDDVAQVGFDDSGDRVFAGFFGGMFVFDLAGPVGAAPAHLRYSNLQWGFEAVWHPTLPWLVMVSTLGSVGAWWPVPEGPVILPFDEIPVAILFTPDGEDLIVAAGDRIVAWPLDGDPRRTVRTLADVPGANFNSLVIDDSGRHVFAADCNSLVSGTMVRAALDGSGAITWRDIECTSMTRVSPSGRYVAAVAEDPDRQMNIVRVWDLDDDDHLDLADPGSPIEPIDFLPDERLLGRRTGTDDLYDVVAIDPETGAQTTVRTGAKTVHGLFERRLLVWVDHDDVTWRDDIESGARESRPPVPIAPAAFRRTFDPEHGMTLVGTRSSEVHVFDEKNGTEHVLLGHKGWVFGMDVDPRGRWIASISLEDRHVRLWPVPRGTPPLERSAADFLELVRARTTIRAVPDTSAAERYRLTDEEPFRGWFARTDD